MPLSPNDILGIPADASLEQARKAFFAKAQGLAAIATGDREITEKLRIATDAYQTIKARLTKGKLHREIEAANPFHAAIIEVCQNVLNTFDSMEDYWIAVKGMRYYGDDQGVRPAEAFYSKERIDPKQRAALIEIHKALSYSIINMISDLDIVREHARRSGSIDDLDRDSFEKSRYQNEDRSSRPYFGIIARKMVRFIASVDPEKGHQGEQLAEDPRYESDRDIGWYYSIAMDTIAGFRGVFSPDIVEKLDLTSARAAETVSARQLLALPSVTVPESPQA